LVSFGYGYSAGIGRFGKPIFFVGRLTLSKLVEAYEESLIRSNASRLKQVVREGARHWLEGASQILGAYRRGAAGSGVTLSTEMSDRLKF